MLDLQVLKRLNFERKRMLHIHKTTKFYKQHPSQQTHIAPYKAEEWFQSGQVGKR